MYWIVLRVFCGAHVQVIYCEVRDFSQSKTQKRSHIYVQCCLTGISLLRPLIDHISLGLDSRLKRNQRLVIWNTHRWYNEYCTHQCRFECRGRRLLSGENDRAIGLWTRGSMLEIQGVSIPLIYLPFFFCLLIILVLLFILLSLSERLRGREV